MNAMGGMQQQGGMQNMGMMGMAQGNSPGSKKLFFSCVSYVTFVETQAGQLEPKSVRPAKVRLVGQVPRAKQIISKNN